MLGNGRSGYSTEIIGFMFLAVSGDFPKSDYESAALTAELRARYVPPLYDPPATRRPLLTDHLFHDTQEISAHHFFHVRLAVALVAQRRRKCRHL